MIEYALMTPMHGIGVRVEPADIKEALEKEGMLVSEDTINRVKESIDELKIYEVYWDLKIGTGEDISQWHRIAREWTRIAREEVDLLANSRKERAIGEIARQIREDIDLNNTRKY